MQGCIHASTCTCTHTHTHARMHAHTHVRAHTHTHTHTLTQETQNDTHFLSFSVFGCFCLCLWRKNRTLTKNEAVNRDWQKHPSVPWSRERRNLRYNSFVYSTSKYYDDAVMLQKVSGCITSSKDIDWFGWVERLSLFFFFLSLSHRLCDM